MHPFTEPLWKVKVQPTPLEERLLEHQALRRLAGIFHYGLAARITPIRHTRLEHTLGVYALTVHFRPFDVTLRAAALLHDIGHLPFSHAAERAFGVNHHARLEGLMGELAPLLLAHHVKPENVLKTISGPSPLRPGAGTLGLDHLDSFVRNAMQCGLSLTAPELLMELSLFKQGVSTYAETAMTLLGIIEDELLRLSSLKVAWADWLSERLLKSLDYSLEHVATMPENELLAQASAHPEASLILGFLYDLPKGVPQPGAPALYANYPLVDGLPAQGVLIEEIAALEAKLELQPQWVFA